MSLNLNPKPGETKTTETKRPPGGRPSTASKPPAKDAGKPSEADLRAQLASTFERIVETLESRGDDELVAILENDAKLMAGSLVSLARRFSPFRSVLTLLLAVGEPVLAFGRLGRVLAGRAMDRRGREPEPTTKATDTPAVAYWTADGRPLQ